MSDIVLAHSYFLNLDPKMQRMMIPYPPLGTLVAAACLKSHQHDITFFDATFSAGPHEIGSCLDREKPRLLVIYDDDFNYLTKMCLTNMRDAALYMIRQAKQRNVSVFVHGSDATDHVEDYLRAGASAVIIGKGEQTLIDACDALSQTPEPDWKSISGLAYSADSVRFTPRREFIQNLDTLPDPNFAMVDIDTYRHAWIKKHGYFSLNVSTTRGCPFHCNWCAKPIYGQIYHSYSPEKIARHVRQLDQSWRPDHLWITDDIFGLKPGWLTGFERASADEGVQIPYKCQTRADLLLRENMIEQLKSTGCEDIWIGAESGSQKILDAMEKGITVDQIAEATRRVKKAGMKISFFIQFGYTGETWEDIGATRKLISQSLPDELGISVSYPLPGTPFYDRVRGQLNDKQNWTDSDDLDMMFTGTFHRQFYKILQRFVHSEYRMHKELRHPRWHRAFHFIYHCIRRAYFRLRIVKYRATE